MQNLHRGEHEFAGPQLPWLSARQYAIFFFCGSQLTACVRRAMFEQVGALVLGTSLQPAPRPLLQRFRQPVVSKNTNEPSKTLSTKGTVLAQDAWQG